MIKILVGGKKHSAWLSEAVNEYEKRLKKPFNAEWQFVDEEKLEEKVLKLSRDEFVILLDENGEILSSPAIAKKFENAFVQGRDVVVVIGGAFGHFSEALKARANLIWSFSKLVFPHQICRLVLIEQIYRAQEICADHPYHHA